MGYLTEDVTGEKKVLSDCKVCSFNIISKVKCVTVLPPMGPL